MGHGSSSRARGRALACPSTAKGTSTWEPYINHLLEVASLVAEATRGEDPDLVIAALLRDAIEDQEVPVDLIAQAFGGRVAQIVAQVTDDKTLPKEVRKEKQIKTAHEKTKDAKLIKLADKTSNCARSHSVLLLAGSVKRRLEYIGWAREVVEGLRGASPWLEQQFDSAAADAEFSVWVRTRAL